MYFVLIVWTVFGRRRFFRDLNLSSKSMILIQDWAKKGSKYKKAVKEMQTERWLLQSQVQKAWYEANEQKRKVESLTALVQYLYGLHDINPDWDTEYAYVNERVVFIGINRNQFLYMPIKEINHQRPMLLRFDFPLHDRFGKLHIPPPKEELHRNVEKSWGEAERDYYFAMEAIKEMDPGIRNNLSICN